MTKSYDVIFERNETMMIVLVRNGVGEYREVLVSQKKKTSYLLKSRTRKTTTPINSAEDKSINGTLLSSTDRKP